MFTRGHHVTTSHPSTTAVVISVVLVAAIVAVLIGSAVLAMRRTRATPTAKIASLPTEQPPTEHKDEHAPKAA